MNVRVLLCVVVFLSIVWLVLRLIRTAHYSPRSTCDKNDFIAKGKARRANQAQNQPYNEEENYSDQ